MDPRSRAAVIKRYQAIVGKDAIVPTSWDQIGNLGLQLQIENADPELAQVLKGKMSSEVELAVISGTWSAEAPAPRDLAAEREAAIQAALAQLPAAKTHEELEAELQQRLANGEQQRRNSAVMTTGRWGA